MLNVTYIRDRATALNLSDSALAQACDVPVDTLSRWLVGDILPRQGSVKALAHALETTLDSVLEAEEPLNVTWIGATRHLSTMDRERAQLSAEDMGRQLQTLRGYVKEVPPLSAPMLSAASDPELRMVGEQLRPVLQMCDMLIPVRWGVPLHHYVAAVIRPPESGAIVYVNLKHGWRSVADALASVVEVTDEAAQANLFIDMSDTGAPDASDAPLANVSHAGFVVESERIFATPVFQALKAFQRAEGGCDAAFISSLLGMHILDAYKLAQTLHQS